MGVSIAFRRLGLPAHDLPPLRLVHPEAVSIAFRRLGPPAHDITFEDKRCPDCLHCLSASWPPGTRLDGLEHHIIACVSIAFRRLGPPARHTIIMAVTGSDTVSIAFRRLGPPAQGRAIVVAVPALERLHCLSASWPPGTTPTVKQLKAMPA